MYNLYILELVWSTHSHTIDLWYIDIHLDTIKLNVYGKCIDKIYYTNLYVFLLWAYQRINVVSNGSQREVFVGGLKARRAWRRELPWSLGDGRPWKVVLLTWRDLLQVTPPPKNQYDHEKKQGVNGSMYFLWIMVIFHRHFSLLEGNSHCFGCFGDG